MFHEVVQDEGVITKTVSRAKFVDFEEFSLDQLLLDVVFGWVLSGVVVLRVGFGVISGVDKEVDFP